MLQFHHMICALEKTPPDYVTASKEMLSSLWAQEVGERAGRLAQIMRDGTY